MKAVSKNQYINKLDDIVNEYNNTYKEQLILNKLMIKMLNLKLVILLEYQNTKQFFLKDIHLFFINNQTFKQSPRKSLILQTISKQFAGANKRRKLNNPLGERAKILLQHRTPKRKAHFWACQVSL